MNKFTPPENPIIAIIGLGYVGLPLAVEFGKVHQTIGFDIKQKRIEELNQGIDKTLEVEKEELNEAKHLTFTSTPEAMATANVFIITVPTPIDANKQPDLHPLKSAAERTSRSQFIERMPSPLTSKSMFSPKTTRLSSSRNASHRQRCREEAFKKILKNSPT